MKLETKFKIGDKVYWIDEYITIIELHFDIVKRIEILEDNIIYHLEESYNSFKEEYLYKRDEIITKAEETLFKIEENYETNN